MVTYEILTASKEHDEDAVRAGLASERPDFRIEAIVDAGNEWSIRLVKDADSDDDDDDKPAFLKEKKEDGEEGETKSEKSDDSEESDGEKSEKGESKEDGSSVDKLKGLMDQLQQTVKEVVDHATQVADEAQSKQDKMEEIHDSVKEHVNDGEGKGEGLEDLPAPPVPADAESLEDVPAPGATPAGPGAPKAPRAPKRPGMPTGKPPARRPGVPGGGIPTFTNVEVANHPGVDAEGNKMSFSQVLAALETQVEEDEDLKGFEIAGLVLNRDGSFSAKLAKKSEEKE